MYCMVSILVQEDLKCLESEIDYSFVESKLLEMRKLSQSYLSVT